MTMYLLIGGLVLGCVVAVLFSHFADAWDMFPLVLVVAIFVCILIAMLIGGAVEIVFNESEVGVAAIHVEITHMDMVESKGRSFPAKTSYRISVTGPSDFAKVIDVSSELYAKLKVGDTVLLNIVTTYNTISEDTVEYRISEMN